LRGIWVRTEAGDIVEDYDIRRPIAIEMEYDVLSPNFMLLPHFDFFDENDVCVFKALDLDPAWRRRKRPVGRYISTVWIPGNLLAEGMLYVAAGLVTLEPDILQFYERDAVAFQIVDSFDGDSARGDWGGRLGGAVRPMLNWGTQYFPNETENTASLITATTLSKSS
jgi:lipopolysaccharide transport system ATP-binding protein